MRAGMDRATCRIVDANFNRAREASRTMEEYCRFALGSQDLTARAKQLRHDLSAAIARLPASQLIAARDAAGDVGAGLSVEHSLRPSCLHDCFTAAAKRLTEALRTLAELLKIEHPSVAARIERLRFEAYSLEKEIVTGAIPLEKFRRVRLYIVVTTDDIEQALALVAACAAGGADCIQLRAKGLADDELFAAAERFVGICRDNGVLSIINDRADVAIAAGADGVHLGQHDLPIAQARKLQLSPLIIGISTHSPRQLASAIEQRPTYAALGPVFKTPTKPALEPVGLDYVRWGSETLDRAGLAHVAIGGITVANLPEVLGAGARTIAVCSAATAVADPVAACRALKEKIVAMEGQSQ